MVGYKKLKNLSFSLPFTHTLVYTSIAGQTKLMRRDPLIKFVTNNVCASSVVPRTRKKKKKEKK